MSEGEGEPGGQVGSAGQSAGQIQVPRRRASGFGCQCVVLRSLVRSVVRTDLIVALLPLLLLLLLASAQSPSWRTAGSSSSSPRLPPQPTAMLDPLPLPQLTPGLSCRQTPRMVCLAAGCWLGPSELSLSSSLPLPPHARSALICSYSSYAHVLGPLLSSCNFCLGVNDCWPSDCALLSHGVNVEFNE